MSKKLFLWILAVSFIMTYGCKNNSDKKQTLNTDTAAVSADTMHSTFYLVPSPEDIFGFSEAKNLVFNQEYLNPIENAEKYNTTKLQEINFGIYSADLAYCAAFNKKEEISKYLDVVLQMSNNIGLAEIFDEQLINRIKNLTPEKDTLMKISNDAYFKVTSYLEKNNRQNTMALIATGGWLEVMYLVVMPTEYTDKETVQKIADQKYIFSNLMNFLEQNKNEMDIASTISDLKPLEDIYNSLTTKEIPNQKQQNNDKIIVGGNKQIVITAEQYKKLKETIIQIRNKITLNNV